MSKHTKQNSTLLFCPFCKECFEGIELCPAHELRLVPAHRLPATERPPDPHEILTVSDPRFGRGFLFVSALLLMVGFLLPFLAAVQNQTVEESAFEMALTRAYNLWVIPSISVFYFWILLKRRTLQQMRGTKVSILFLAFVVMGSLVFTLWRAERANSIMSPNAQIQWQIGVWVLVFGFLLAVFSSFILGTSKAKKSRKMI